MLNFGTRAGIGKALQRLAKSDDIRRHCSNREFYDVPKMNSVTGRVTTPDYTAILEAVARRDQIRILADGLTAAIKMRSVAHSQRPRTARTRMMLCLRRDLLVAEGLHLSAHDSQGRAGPFRRPVHFWRPTSFGIWHAFEHREHLRPLRCILTICNHRDSTACRDTLLKGANLVTKSFVKQPFVFLLLLPSPRSRNACCRGSMLRRTLSSIHIRPDITAATGGFEKADRILDRTELPPLTKQKLRKLEGVECVQPMVTTDAETDNSCRRSTVILPMGCRGAMIAWFPCSSLSRSPAHLKCWILSAMQQGGSQYGRLIGAFQRVFGATIFLSSDRQLEKAAVVHHARFNFMSEALIWYSRDPGLQNLPGDCQDMIVLSEELYREIQTHHC